MTLGETPFKIPDSETAIDSAKEFCQTRGLTPSDVKIVKKDGFVMVVVKRDGVRCRVD